jgi:hypothetical protein
MSLAASRRREQTAGLGCRPSKLHARAAVLIADQERRPRLGAFRLIAVAAQQLRVTSTIDRPRLPGVALAGQW